MNIRTVLYSSKYPINSLLRKADHTGAAQWSWFVESSICWIAIFMAAIHIAIAWASLSKFWEILASTQSRLTFILSLSLNMRSADLSMISNATVLVWRHRTSGDADTWPVEMATSTITSLTLNAEILSAA